ELSCTSSSNANGSANPTPDPDRIFVCSSYLSPGLSSGTAWTSANITSALRPTFLDGVTPQHTAATMNAHATSELLPNAGSSFKSTGSNTTYDWGAKGRIS